MSKYIHLYEMVFNKPHLCTPEYAETVLAVLKDKLELEGMFDINGEAKDGKDPNLKGDLQVIPIIGSMVHRGGFMDAMSGIQSYAGIQSQIQQALDNPQVKQILLEMDSPGGSVAGAFDLKDFILEAKQKKPIYAIANDSMASAAYLIGSACTEVYATQTASVGSIGVVAMHMDQSERNKMEGLKPTFIYAGDYKVAGNPHEALEGEALSYLQESVQDSYEMFVNAVSSNRGLDEQVVRDTEARTYRGEKAKEIGLVDGVMSMDALLEKLASNATNSPQRVSFQSMSKGPKMDKDEIEQLAADLAAVKTENEGLRKALIENGFKITAEGVELAKVEEAVAETLEIDGKVIDLSAMPEEAAATLKELASEKANAALEKRASAELPNFDKETAKALLSAGLSEEVMQTLKAADALFAETMEEAGETSVEADMTDPREQMDALVNEYMEERNVSIHKARVEVAKTAKGRELQKALMKG